MCNDLIAPPGIAISSSEPVCTAGHCCDICFRAIAHGLRNQVKYHDPEN
jgi:hypothetical protein